MRNLAISTDVDTSGINLSELLDVANEEERVRRLHEAVATVNASRDRVNSPSPVLAPNPSYSRSDDSRSRVRLVLLRITWASLTAPGPQELFYGEGSTAMFAQRTIAAFFSGSYVPHSLPNSAIEAIIAGQNSYPPLSTPPYIPDTSSPLFYDLVQSYWDHIHPTFPILHKPSFDRAFASGFFESDSSFRRLGEPTFAPV